MQDLEDTAGFGGGWWTNDLKEHIPPETVLRQTRATDMTVEGGPVFVHTVGTAGTMDGEAAPNNVATVLSLRTDKRGRSYRGRIYLGGIDIGSMVSTVDFSVGYMANLLADLATLWTGLDAVGYDMVVVSKQHNGVPTNPADMNVVTTITTDVHADSQRRRLAGRGS